MVAVPNPAALLAYQERHKRGADEEDDEDDINSSGGNSRRRDQHDGLGSAKPRSARSSQYHAVESNAPGGNGSGGSAAAPVRTARASLAHVSIATIDVLAEQSHTKLSNLALQTVSEAGVVQLHSREDSSTHLQ